MVYNMKIAVVGAGICGTLSAYFLAKAGFQVTVYDREPTPAMACSKANGGQLSVCNSGTWNTWSNIQKGLSWLGSSSAPLLIRPKPELAKLTWLAGFLRHTINGSHKENTVKTIELGLRSRALYREIEIKEGLEFDQGHFGLMKVFSNHRSFEAAKNQLELFSKAGLHELVLTPAKAVLLEPMLSTFNNLVGAIYSEDDWTGDANMFCTALMQVLRERYNVAFNSSCSVLEATPDGKLVHTNGAFFNIEYFDVIVLASGHELRKQAKELGDFLNIYPVKGYSITLNVNDRDTPYVSLLDDDRKIVCSRLGNRFRVAGTAELDGDNKEIKQERIEPLLSWVRENFPTIKTNRYDSWACLRPMSSDMMPIIKRRDAIWYHGGHGHLGWTLGAATAKDLADQIKLQS